MRTAADLIEELKHNGEGYDLAALIVGFEGTTIYIRSDEPDPLTSLNNAIAQGGEPVGWCRFKQGGSLDMGVLEEYQDEAWAHDYIGTLAGTIRALVKGEVN